MPKTDFYGKKKNNLSVSNSPSLLYVMYVIFMNKTIDFDGCVC